MVMVLEQRMINEIARIGRLRYPNEACGLMLPTPVRGIQIIEIPNRAKKPQNDFVMFGSDMVLALERLFDEVTDTIIHGLTAWHTHPRGGVGPSRIDLKNKPANIHSLVVTLMDEGPPMATWF